MIDERKDAQRGREGAGMNPAEHATFEEPKGGETVTDGGLVPPDEATKDVSAL